MSAELAMRVQFLSLNLVKKCVVVVVKCKVFALKSKCWGFQRSSRYTKLMSDWLRVFMHVRGQELLFQDMCQTISWFPSPKRIGRLSSIYIWVAIFWGINSFHHVGKLTRVMIVYPSYGHWNKLVRNQNINKINQNLVWIRTLCRWEGGQVTL